MPKTKELLVHEAMWLLIVNEPVLYTCMNRKLSAKGAKMARGIQLCEKKREEVTIVSV